jgi:hypothetical protein
MSTAKAELVGTAGPVQPDIRRLPWNQVGGGKEAADKLPVSETGND